MNIIMELDLTQWLMVVLTAVIAIFTILIWKVYEKMAWLSGSMESYSQIDLRMQAKNENIDVIDWDPTIEPPPLTHVHGKKSTIDKIYMYLPPNQRKNDPSWRAKIKMLFKGSSWRLPRLEIWGSFVVILTSCLIYKFKPLTIEQLITLLLNLEGTVFLASSISFHIPPIGNDFCGKIKWAIIEFPKYGSPASFNPLRFYFGVLFLVLGNILSAWLF